MGQLTVWYSDGRQQSLTGAELDQASAIKMLKDFADPDGVTISISNVTGEVSFIRHSAVTSARYRDEVVEQ